MDNDVSVEKEEGKGGEGRRRRRGEKKNRENDESGALGGSETSGRDDDTERGTSFESAGQVKRPFSQV